MSEVSICNSALAKIGVPPITSFGDGTTESNFCSRQYPILRDEVLTARTWTFATGRAKLLPDATPPEWGYSQRFLIPTEWLRVTYVTDVIATSGDQSQVTPLQWNREEKYILTDAAVIYVIFTKTISDTTLFSPLFAETLAYRIAVDGAVALKKSNSLMVNMQNLYQGKLNNASTTDGAQGSREKKYLGSFVLRR